MDWALMVVMGVLGVLAMATTGDDPDDPGNDDPDNDDADDDPDDDPDTDDEPGGAIRDGMTKAEVEALLWKERDRLDKKGKSDLEKAREAGAADAKAAAEEEQKKTDMSEIERAEADKTKAEEEVKAANARADAAEQASTRTIFIANNAGDIGQDKAWRSYLDAELAAAADEDKPEDILARVQGEYDATVEGRAGTQGNVGGRSRPSKGTQPGANNKPAGDGSTLEDYMPD